MCDADHEPGGRHMAVGRWNIGFGGDGEWRVRDDGGRVEHDLSRIAKIDKDRIVVV